MLHAPCPRRTAILPNPALHTPLLDSSPPPHTTHHTRCPQALLSGNAKWASNPALGALLHDQAVLIALDKQEFVGRTAIIRRLNQGARAFCLAMGVGACPPA